MIWRPAADRQSIGMSALQGSRMTDNNSHQPRTDPPRSVDIIVIGAGAAGSVVAARLSESEGCEVLLLEAGADHTGGESTIPGLAFFALDDQVTYANLSVPQPGAGGRQIPVVTGRGLGGGSSVNTMAWWTGHPDDYDDWATGGAYGWSDSDVRPMLRSMEHYALGPDEYRGSGGPMIIDKPRYVGDIDLAFLAACAEADIPSTDDFNGVNRIGAGLAASNIRDGVRHSVVDGYLRAAMRRPRLSVVTGAVVARILIERGRSVGVVLEDGREILARDRIVLCAGAVHSPHLLMRSGIGPAEHLLDHGITVNLDSPGVGVNFHDHPDVLPVWPVQRGRTLLDSRDDEASLAYRLARRGPQATCLSAAAMLPLPGEGAAPALQMLLFGVGIAEGVALEQPAVSVAIGLQTPFSRGTIRLGDDGPLVDPAYFSDDRDVTRLVQGVRIALDIMSRPPIREFCGPALFPDESGTDDELADWVRTTSASFWHPAGSLRMGGDALAPVSPGDLSVKGVDGLYVVDASVMPTLTRGNTQAPVIMIAERAVNLWRR
jgi:choline dehydrogenase